MSTEPSDNGNFRIRRIDTETTIIQTVAGDGTPGIATEMGEAMATETGLGILYGGGIFLASPSELFLAEGQWDRIRKVNLETGIISTIAEGKLPDNGDNGPALKARLLFGDLIRGVGSNKPGDVTVNASRDTVLLAESAHHRIRKIDLRTGLITTIAGIGKPGYNGDGQSAKMATLSEPSDVVFDPQGNVLIADYQNDRIRRIQGEDGVITTVVGNGKGRLNADYDMDDDDYDLLDDNGPALEAAMVSPFGITFNTSGDLFITHYGLFIRRVDSQTQIITTRLGCCAGSNTRSLRGIAISASGILYAANINRGILKVEPQATRPMVLFFDKAFQDVAVNGKGMVFAPVMDEHRVYRIGQPVESLTSIAGGTPGYAGDNGPAINATFVSPSAVAIDSANNLYIIDSGNHAVRVIKNGAR